MRLFDLKDTIPMMESEDHQERFRAEVHQLGIRLEKLENMVEKYENGQLNFTPVCSIGLFKGQIAAMKLYMTILSERALLEKINL